MYQCRAIYDDQSGLAGESHRPHRQFFISLWDAFDFMLTTESGSIELIVLAHLLKSKSQKKQFLKFFESDESSWNITLTHYPWTPFICKKKDFAVNIPRTVFSRINQIWRPRPGRFRSTAALVLCFELTCNNIVFVFCILWLFPKIISGSFWTI